MGISNILSVSKNYGLIHTVRFFLIATAIPLIATNGLHKTQWKCSQNATAKTSLLCSPLWEKQIAVTNRAV